MSCSLLFEIELNECLYLLFKLFTVNTPSKLELDGRLRSHVVPWKNTSSLDECGLKLASILLDGKWWWQLR